MTTQLTLKQAMGKIKKLEKLLDDTQIESKLNFNRWNELKNIKCSLGLAKDKLYTANRELEAEREIVKVYKKASDNFKNTIRLLQSEKTQLSGTVIGLRVALEIITRNKGETTEVNNEE